MKKKNENKNTLSAGFEPARENPNGFRVHRLNHSATTTYTYSLDFESIVFIYLATTNSTTFPVFQMLK